MNNRSFGRGGYRSPTLPRRFGFPLQLEELETREVPVVITPFTPRFSTNDTGTITLVGNTLQTVMGGPGSPNPGRTQQQAINAQNQSGFVNNNDWVMSWVDVDNNPTTTNSSTAGLTLPAGSTVLFAGLYWGSVVATAQFGPSAATVLFRTPTSGSNYTTINGSFTGSTNFTGIPQGTIYQGFADVTALVRAAGNGTYGIANVQGTLQTGSYAGWGLVVVARVPGAPARNLTVVDGYVVQASTDPPLNFTVSGFTTPPSGPVASRVGALGYEGDFGTSGDYVALNGTRLGDAITPPNNFANSTISSDGQYLTDKTPNYRNQFGFGFKNIAVPAGVIPNGASSATFTLGTSGDGYFAGVLTFTTDLYSPTIEETKTFTDVNGGKVGPGDFIDYTVTFENTGQDGGSNFAFFDAIPANTTYVPGSLLILDGPNAGAKTDAVGDDQAEFDAANNRVVYRLGTNADASTGGTLAIGDTTTIRFRVRVNDDVPSLATISNQGSATYRGATTGFNLTSDTNVVSFAVEAQADLGITKLVSDGNPNVNDVITYTITVSNFGPDVANGVTVQDLLPASVEFLSYNASQGSYDSVSGLWTVGTLTPNGMGGGPGGSATLFLSVRVIDSPPGTNSATISGASVPDPNPDNNTATAVVDPQVADLVLDKAVSNATPNVGDTITFTLTLTNNGPNDATNVRVSDPLPPAFTFVSASSPDYDPTTGIWSVGDLANGDTVTLTITAQVGPVQIVPVINAAVASATQFDPNPNNNSDTVAVSPQLADLQVVKSVNNATPNVSNPVIFTIRISNLGINDATNVTVHDLLDNPGLPYDASSATKGTYDPATGIWTVGDLAVGEEATLLIRAIFLGHDPTTNTATIDGDQFDPNLDNNNSTATITPQVADLQLTKTVDNPTPNVGEIITFTLTAFNAGPFEVGQGAVVDPIPAGLTFLSANPSVGTYDPATRFWVIGPMTVGGEYTLEITARVDTPNPITNTALIFSAVYDPDQSNNLANVSVTPQQADVSVVKEVSDETPNVGDTITYTITVTNSQNSPNTATNVVSTDVLPDGFGLESSTPSVGTYDSSTGKWTIGDLAPGASATLTVTMTVLQPFPVTNFARVAADQFDTDLTNNSTSALVTPQQADLNITKTVDNPLPDEGDEVTFTLTLTNSGPTAAANVTVTDLLPAGLEFVSATPSQGTYDENTGIWTVGTVPANLPTPITLLITATVTSEEPVTNIAMATSDTPDPTPDNNTSVIVTPQLADLVITKSVSDATPNLGDTITYTVTLSNPEGPTEADNVIVTDLLPAGLQLVSATPSQGTYDPVEGIWTVGTVDVGDVLTLVFAVVVVSPTQSTNIATTTSDTPDPNTDNNETPPVVVTPQVADLSISKSVSNPTPNLGDTITYTLAVVNNGPTAAENVVVADLLPAGLTYVSDTSGGAYDPVSGEWTIGTIAAPDPTGTNLPVTLVITVIVSDPEPSSNIATVDSDTPDPNDGNNETPPVDVTPQVADLSISKSVSDDTPNLGDTITYTLTLTNNGSTAAANATVTDQLPAGLTFVSFTADQGTYNATTGIWAVGTVANGAVLELVITVVVSSVTPSTNIATTTSTTPDPNTDNNETPPVVVTPQLADLTLVKTVDNVSPNVGDQLVYTLTLTNNGPTAAAAVVVSDPLPAGLQFDGFTADRGSYDAATGLWTVGTVQNGEVLRLFITVTLIGSGEQVNTAIVTSDTPDPDPNDNTTVVVVPQQADLEVNKAITNNAPPLGSTITYVVQITNHGPFAATGVTLTDLLPSGMAFVSAIAEQGSYDDTTGIWTVGTIAIGDTMTLQVTATVNTLEPQTNTATVTADQFDPNVSNNTDTTVAAPRPAADLAVTKRPSARRVEVGRVVQYTIVVRNLGPNDATNVTLMDKLPAGLQFVSARATQGSYRPGSGVWRIGTLASGGVATLRIVVRVAVARSIRNVTSVQSAIFDPVLSNNTAAALIMGLVPDISKRGLLGSSGA